MASPYDGNYSSYWSYSPSPYCNSYDGSSSGSSYFESPVSSSSPRMVMVPVYEQEQQQPCCYYSNPIFSCHQCRPSSSSSSSSPIVQSSQVKILRLFEIFLTLNLYTLDYPCFIFIIFNDLFNYKSP